MGQMNIRQAGIADPVLTAIALGWEPDQSLVGDTLFPVVNVDSRTGKLLVFGKEAYQVISTKRAPGSAVKRYQVSYGEQDYILSDYSLEAVVPNEIADELGMVGIQAASDAVMVTRSKMALEREKEAAVLATTAENFPAGNKDTLSGADQWSHADSNPFAAVEAAKNAIRAKIGKRPNVLIVGPHVLSALRTHPMVLDRLSTASDRPPATIAQLQSLFEIASVQEGAATEEVNGSFVDLWGKSAVFAYVNPKSASERGSMSFGHTYNLRGRPIVEVGYEDRPNKSMIYPVTDARRRYLVGNTAGFLFSDAVA